MTIRVLIADDHEVVRRGLGLMFRDTELTIVAEAATGEEAVELAQKHQPDVALLDVRLPGIDGLDVLEQLRTRLPQLRVVMLSTFDSPTYVARAAALGACDYVLKGAPRGDLLSAVARAVNREPASDASPFRQLQKRMALGRSNGESKSPLTDRELQVLRHIALGLSNRDIGLALNISVETVKEHVQNTLRKLNCSDRTAAAVWALRNKFA